MLLRAKYSLHAHRGQTSEHARRIAWGLLRLIWKSYTHVATHWLIDLISEKTKCTCSTLFLLISEKQICTCSTLIYIYTFIRFIYSYIFLIARTLVTKHLCYSRNLSFHFSNYCRFELFFKLQWYGWTFADSTTWKSLEVRKGFTISWRTANHLRWGKARNHKAKYWKPFKERATWRGELRVICKIYFLHERLFFIVKYL